MIKNDNNSISSVYDKTTCIGKIMKGVVKVYESFKNILISGIPPLTLFKSKGVDLIDYKIYGNSIQDGTPTPEAPIEVESVGERTKNFCNPNKDIEIINNYYGKKYNLPVGTYTISASGTVNSGDYINTYVINNNNETVSTHGYVVNGNALTTPAITFTIESGQSLFVRYATNLSTNVSLAEVKRAFNRYIWQIEEGNVETKYEPYGYKMPIKINGKVLNDSSTDVKDYYINASGSLIYDGASAYSQLIPVKPNTSYTLSCNVIIATTAVQNKRLHAYDKDGNWIQQICFINYPIGNVGYKTITGVTPSNCAYVRISHWPSVEEYLMLEEGIKPTENEPYVEPITTNIYLDEPLKSGEYLHYAKQQLVKDNVSTSVELPNIPTIKGTTIIEVDTTIQPSNMEVTYKGK